MKKNRPYLSLASCLLMMAALVWLTVSTPFVYAADQMVKTEKEQKSGEPDESSPLAGTTEEKSENINNTFSEYLGDLLHELQLFSLSVGFNCRNTDVYFAFSPELICPPPDYKI